MRKILTFAFCLLHLALGAQEAYRGQVLEQAGQFEEAFAVYRSVLENSPKDRQALLGFIRVCRHLERYDSLLTVLRQLEGKGERSFELGLGIVEALLKTRRRQEGLTRAQALLQSSPERVLEIAQVLTEGGEPNVAAQYLEGALKTSGFRMDYADFLIGLYEETGRLPEAAGIISDIVNKDERHLQRLLERLSGYGRQANYPRVIKELGKIKDPKLRARAQAAVYLGAGEEMAAVRVVQTVLSEQELYLFAQDCEQDGALNAALTVYSQQNAWADCARVLRLMGRVEEALRFLERDTTPAGVLELAEIARIEQRDFKKALTAYQKVLRHRPKDRAALYGLARALIGLKHLDSAAKVLKAITPPDTLTLFLLAQVYFYQGEFDSVPRAATELNKRFPNSRLVNDGLRLALLTYAGERAKKLSAAMLDYEAQNDQEGIKTTRELTQGKDLVSQEAYSLLARFYSRQKKYKQALAVIDTFLIQFPKGELAPKIRLQQAEIYRDGLKDEAHFRLTLERLILDFPGSPYVPIARNLLQGTPAVKPGEVR
ncbi:MAG: tetratricopeptide repeat protein [candidate division WOR-3 bacterium]